MKRYIIALLVFSASSTMAAGLKPFQDKDTELWGLKNAAGKIVVKPQYQTILDNANSTETLIPAIKNNRVYRLDQKGKVKFESVFYDNGPDYYEEGLARFIEKGKVGFHDEKGNVVVKPSYDFARYFQNGHAVVCLGCWSAYDANAKFAPMSSGGAPQSITDQHMEVKGGKWGAINKKGEVVIPIELNSISEVDAKLQAKK